MASPQWNKAASWFVLIGVLLGLITFFMADNSKNRTILIVSSAIFLFVGLSKMLDEEGRLKV